MINLLKKLILMSLLTVYSYAYTPKQVEVANIVYQEWSKIKIRGNTFQSTGVAICLTESSLGRSVLGDIGLKVTDASIGIMQLRIDTTRFMATKYRELEFINNMSDTHLVNFLIRNREWNARIAGLYFKWCYENYKTYFKAVSLYNGGLKNVKYYNKVIKNRANLRNLINQIKD